MQPFTKMQRDLQLALNSNALVILNPSLNVFSISGQPRYLCPDRILTLRKSLIESFGAAVLEEILNPSEAFWAGEARCANRHHGAKHR